MSKTDLKGGIFLNYKYIKNVVKIFIVTVMLLLPIQVQALGIGSPISGSQEFLNINLPKGARIGSTETVQASIAQSSNSGIIYSLSDLKNVLKDNMNNRSTDLSIAYKADTSGLKTNISNIIKDILSQDDYLNYSYAGYKFSYSGYQNDVTITFSFKYLATKEQEEFVDSKVNSILGQIVNSSMSSDEKEKNIHDYIVKNVQYDTTLTRYSAYNALYEGKTVCQGYALLTYKMLKNVGIENRIVSGYGNNGQETESHAWNLVKLNGNWYQLDCTWDDPVPDVKGRVVYDYYNIPDSKMQLDHTWDHSNYPSATTVYKESTSEGVNIDFSSYKKWNNITNVPKNKNWSVKFVKPFDVSTVNSNNILVFEQNNSLMYPIKDISITYNENKDTIYVKPLNQYTAGKTYYLVVTQKVLSKDGKVIPKPIVVTFKIEE